MMLVIYGPTSTSKSAQAIHLSKKFKGEIISADSRQVYKGLDIGSGKVNFDAKVEKHQGFWQVNGVKIHGFDLAMPGVQFNVLDFYNFATKKIEELTKEQKLPIIAGGTGFYINSLISPIESIGIPQNPKLRKELSDLNAKDLFQKLSQVDSSKANSLNDSDRKNPRRLIRAIEIAIAIQKPKSKNQNPKTKTHLLIGLTAPNDYIYKRSDQWIEERLIKGLIEEIEGLLNDKIDSAWLENLGLEYKWITRFVKGQIPLSAAKERLKVDTHNFIRRQKTWFKKFENLKLFDISLPAWQKKLEKTVSLWHISTKPTTQ